MVRLIADEKDEPDQDSGPFQFQIGSINSGTGSDKKTTYNVFQFQFGSINRN